MTTDFQLSKDYDYDVARAIKEIQFLATTSLASGTEFYFVYCCDREVMAVACESSERLRSWWKYSSKEQELTRAAWGEIQAIMASRAAKKAIDKLLAEINN